MRLTTANQTGGGKNKSQELPGRLCRGSVPRHLLPVRVTPLPTYQVGIMNKRLILNLEGRVHGVGFRVYTVAQADALGLTGYVKNEPDKTVTIVAEGTEENLKKLAEWAKKGPKMAWVSKMRIRWEISSQEFEKFEIKY